MNKQNSGSSGGGDRIYKSNPLPQEWAVMAPIVISACYCKAKHIDDVVEPYGQQRSLVMSATARYRYWMT